MGEFKPNGLGLSEFMQSDELGHHIHDVAEKIANAARATSPIGNALSDEEKVRYVDSWRVEDGIKQGVPRRFNPNRRVESTVINETPYAAAIEWGNGRTDPPHRQRKTIDAHHTLTRAIDAARE